MLTQFLILFWCDKTYVNSFALRRCFFILFDDGRRGGAKLLSFGKSLNTLGILGAQGLRKCSQSKSDSFAHF
jgi:hypothetical protein